MSYTPSQIKTAKKLVKWMMECKTPEDSARIEVAKLLKRYEHKRKAIIIADCYDYMLIPVNPKD